MTPHYYNEIDPYPAQWLRNLIAAGHIPAGDVDERSIADVQPDELRGYTQCHFFAGIGGWPLALRLAGWPEDRPVWTGSCPCQPFSAMGLRLGSIDPRHLWPELFRLISKCRPATVFGEQVASADGRNWLSGVFDDLEGMAYAVAGADLCATGVGLPHIRQRLYWTADADQAIENERTSSRKQSVRFGNSASLWREDKPSCGWVADGISRRMEHVGAYGNAIIPQLGAEFVSAYMECRP